MGKIFFLLFFAKNEFMYKAEIGANNYLKEKNSFLFS